jgi:hypothetical protein
MQDVFADETYMDCDWFRTISCGNRQGPSMYTGPMNQETMQDMAYKVIPVPAFEKEVLQVQLS